MSKENDLERLWKRNPTIALRKLSKRMIHIEGNSAGLSFLGKLLTDHADAPDCGEQFSADGAGSRLFSKDSKCGFYIHRLPCKQAGGANLKR
jgi:hypothetical protein